MGIEQFLFGSHTLAMLRRSLDIQSFRGELIASNLANVDTPGYKAREVDFQKAFDEEKDRLGAQTQLVSTNPKHFTRQAASSVPIEVEENDSERIRVDGNTVDQDDQLRKLAEAQLMYSASINAMAKKLQMINFAVSGSKI